MSTQAPHRPAATPSHKVATRRALAIALTVCGLVAAVCFWLATPDSDMHSVAYYRMGVTIAIGGALIAWVLVLGSRVVSLEIKVRDLRSRDGETTQRLAAAEAANEQLVNRNNDLEGRLAALERLYGGVEEQIRQHGDLSAAVFEWRQKTGRPCLSIAEDNLNGVG